LFFVNRIALHQTQRKNLLSTAVCLLPTALAPSRAQDDREFEAQVEFYAVTWGAEISWEISNDAGADEVVHCFESGCYQLHRNDIFGDGWNAAFMGLNFPDAGLIIGDIPLE